MLLLKKNNVNIDKLCKKGSGKLRWNQESLINEPDIYFIFINEKLKTDDYVKSVHLQKIIEVYNRDTDIKYRVEEIRKIEDKVRNKAAHEIIKIDEEYIKERTNKTPKEICDILKMLFADACKDLKKDAWDSYNRMNDYIIDNIK